MIVIIPHPTEQLIFANAQREILEYLNASRQIDEIQKDGCIVFPEFPLWIKFRDESEKDIAKIFSGDLFKNKNEKIKSLRKKLKPIKVCDWQEKDGKLFFPVEMIYDGEIFHGEIIFGKTIQNLQLPTDNSKLSNINSQFEIINCKVFRIAQAEFETTDNGVTSWRVSDSIWIKI